MIKSAEVLTSEAAISVPMLKKSARRGRRDYLIYALCACLYLLPFMRLLLLETDEGSLVSGAVRVARGQMFSRDFFEIIGPGTFYWVALFFKLLGETFIAERTCLFITSLATGLLMYFLSRRICNRYQVLPSLILTGTYFGALWPTISHHVDSNCFALLSVACLIVWQDKRKDYLLLVAGVLIGVTTCFLQTKGGLLLLGSAAWLLAQYRWRLVRLSSIGVLVGGFSGLIALVSIYFWEHHALRALIYTNVIWPSKHYGAANIVPYAYGIVTYYWNGWVGPAAANKWLVGMATVLIGPFIFVAALPVVVGILGILRRIKPARAEILLYWLCGEALWLSEIHRKDMCHLVFGSPLLIILCIYYIEQYQMKVARWTLQVLSISASCLVAFNLILVMYAHPVSTRAGSVAVLKNDPVFAALERRASFGEEIFVYPTYPMYYFLSGTTNPTRWSGMGYGYNSASDFQEVIRILDQRQVKHVVWDTLFREKVKVIFPSMKPPRPEELIMEPYLETHYRVVWEGNGVLIMERKSQDHTN
jgi:hypothetical protein